MGIWILGGGDWCPFPALVAPLLAKPLDRVMGLVLGHRKLPFHRQRCQLLVFLCLVLCSVHLDLRIDVQRRIAFG